MNTGKLERFAKAARLILLDGVERKIRYWGFDEKGNSSEQPVAIQGGYIFRGQVYDDPDVPSRWLSLQTAIHTTGFKEVIEKASYVWFNRMVAIKILSKNGYEPAMLDYQDEQVLTPQLLVKARRGQYQYLNENEKSRLNAVISDYSNELRAFGILLIGYCHHNILLSNVFGLIDDYTELLLPDDILSEKGFLNLLNTSDAITDEDYRQVELIGWLYQFYISDKKDEVFKGFKNNKKAEARDIPAATQIFTPNWIVKYMVQNTVGRIWLDHKPDSPLREKMKYLVEPSEDKKLESGNNLEGESPLSKNKEYLFPSPQGEGAQRADEVRRAGGEVISEVSKLKLLDPASGSGHILVEGFDLLYDMYIEEYYSSSEAVVSILQNNLFGLDIDLRAAQLARFAILLKASSKYPDILKKGIMPQVYAMPEPCEFTRQEVLDFLGNEGAAYEKHLSSVLEQMQLAQNLGSIMRFDLPVEVRSFIVNRLKELQHKSTLSFYEQSVLPRIAPFIHVYLVMSQLYEAVAANPPYMGRGNMNGVLKQYLEKNYPISKSDLYTVFIDYCTNILQIDGRLGLIAPPSWMFTISYQDLRNKIVNGFFISSFLNFGRGVFGADFGTASFILANSKPSSTSISIFRTLYRGKSLVDSIIQKRNWFLDTSYNYLKVKQVNFLKIPSCPLAYWLPETAFTIFEKFDKLEKFADVKQGLATADNDRFRRNWHEVSILNSSLRSKRAKWYPYNSGGEYRKWYGNQYYLVNWQLNGHEIKNIVDENGKLRSRPQNVDYYFKESISWSKVTIGGLAFRYYPEGFIFDVAGCSIFPKNASSMNYLLGLINSILKEYFVYAVTQSVNYEVGIINNIPIISVDGSYKGNEINFLVRDCIIYSKEDWDSREFSWEFQQHPLIHYYVNNLEDSFQKWLQNASNKFFNLKANEEDLNRIFIEIYGLQHELFPDVPLKDITILQDELDYAFLEKIEPPYEGQLLPIKKEVVMQQLISYAIGCYMGRYRLDKPGLHIAYPNPASNEITPYSISSPLLSETGKEVQFEIDDDAIIPIMGNNGVFTDDALIRIKNFIELVWGEETLSQNLNFLQHSLNKDIEDYLVKDFWKYHCRVYSKRPIYWLFSSTKGAFQVLVYMHRMNKFTPDKIRTKYLLRHIQYLRNESERLSLQSSTLSRDEERRLEKLIKDLKECEEYDILLKDIASRQIEFDLDDGVVKNYALYKGVVAEIK